MSMTTIEPISIPLAAAILGVSRRTIYHWVETGVMPAPGKIGGRAYWLPSDFNSWLERCLSMPSRTLCIAAPSTSPVRRPGRPRATPAP